MANTEVMESRSSRSDETEVNDRVTEMSGPQKAAAFLIALGSDACAKVFKVLGNDEVELIASEIAKMQSVNSETIEYIFQEFREMADAGGITVQGGMDYAAEVLNKALGADSAEAVERIRASSQKKPFDRLADSPDSMELLMDMVQEEQPQTIALILAYLKEQQAAQVLSSLPQDLQIDVVSRIANMKTVSPEVLSQIQGILDTKPQGQEQVNIGGAKAAAEILNRVDPDIEKRIMGSIVGSDPDMAQKISEHIFTYDNIVMISDAGIQRMLQEVEENDLLMALKVSTDNIKDKFFNNMSDRRRQMVEEDLEQMPPARLKDAIAAQKRILDVVKEMSQSGQIEIVRDEEEEVFV